ncbi:signal peptidase I [Ruminococcus sp. OM05-10BH]|nr:signal peptidase I [Ruminococcus sp. OM05-10BH]
MNKWFRRLDTILILCAACYVLLFACPTTFGILPVRVLSGSMAPEILEGDMAYIRQCKENAVVPGDVIAFRTENDQLVLHRLIEKTSEGLVTKGDANEHEDFSTADPANVVGTLLFSLPKGAVWYEKITSWKTLGILLFYSGIRMITIVHQKF